MTKWWFNDPIFYTAFAGTVSCGALYNRLSHNRISRNWFKCMPTAMAFGLIFHFAWNYRRFSFQSVMESEELRIEILRQHSLTARTGNFLTDQEAQIKEVLKTVRF